MTFSRSPALLLLPNSLINVTTSSWIVTPAVQGMTKTDGEKKERKRLKWRDTGAESCWPARRRSYQWVTAVEWLLCHTTCRQGRRRDLLNGLDRDFLRCLMELTLFYLCATSVRALYAKRQSTSPQPFQCVRDHCRVIDKNVVGQGQCDNWESLPQILNRLSGVKQQATATEYHKLQLFPLEPISALCTLSWIPNLAFIEKQREHANTLIFMDC